MIKQALSGAIVVATLGTLLALRNPVNARTDSAHSGGKYRAVIGFDSSLARDGSANTPVNWAAIDTGSPIPKLTGKQPYAPWQFDDWRKQGWKIVGGSAGVLVLEHD